MWSLLRRLARKTNRMKSKHSGCLLEARKKDLLSVRWMRNYNPAWSGAWGFLEPDGFLFSRALLHPSSSPLTCPFFPPFPGLATKHRKQRKGEGFYSEKLDSAEGHRSWYCSQVYFQFLGVYYLILTLQSKTTLIHPSSQKISIEHQG